MKFNIFGMELGIGRIPMDIQAPRRGEMKSSATAPIIYQLYMGAEQWGVWTKRNIREYSVDAYKMCLPAYRAINLVAKNASVIPLRVMRGDPSDLDNATELDPKHPLVQLLRRPNPTMSGSTFTEHAIQWLMLSGNSYLEGVGNTRSEDNYGEPIDGGGGPKELWVQRADRMRVLPSPLGVAGYIYDINASNKRWMNDPVTNQGPICHIKFFHPLDDWYGMSPVEAAAMEVDARNMSGKWNQALLQNGAKPSGALVYKPAETDPASLTPKQKEAIKDQINDGMVGPGNAGRIPIIDGRLEWMQMSLTPAELDWLESRRESARDVVQAFGVPSMLLGIPGDNTYANMEEARCGFHQDTVIPILMFYVDHLNRWLCPGYGEDIFILADYDNIPALAPVREKLWTRVTNATWMTVNEKRVATGFDPLDIPEADEVFIASGLIPLTGSMDQPDGNENLDANGDPIDPADDPNADPNADPTDKPKPKPKPDPKKPVPPKKARKYDGHLQVRPK